MGTTYLSNIGATILLVTAGVCMIVFRRPLTRLGMRGQEKTWGFRFSPAAWRRTERIAVPLTGIAWIAMGIAFLFFNPHPGP